MKRSAHISVLLLALLITLIAHSQPKLYIRHFGAEEGLLSPGINCLAEDRDGFIWIGSNMGLTRFDGIHFRNFPIVHEHDGAFALQPRHIVVDDENRIRISTRRGMFVFDHATGLFHRDSTYQQSLLHNGRDSLSWEQPVDAQLLAQIGWHSPTGGVRCMLTDHEDGVWIGSFYEGLFYVDRSARRFRTFSPSPAIVRPICISADGSIFVGTEDRGLFHLNATDSVLRPLPQVPAKNIQSLVADGDTLWIGTFGQGIYRYSIREQRITAHWHGDAACSPYVVCLLLTPAGDLLAGTTEGLFVRRRHEARFHRVAGAADGFIHTLAQTSDGHVWAGSLDRPLRRVDHGVAVSDTAFTYPCVTSLLADADGRLWIGTDSKGVWLRERDGTCRPTLLTGGVLGSSANAIAVDQQRRLWVTSFNGLFCMDPRIGAVTRHSQHDGLPTNFFSYSSVAMLPDGQMLMGTHHGLVAFLPMQFQQEDSVLHPFFTNVRVGDRDTLVCKRLTLSYDAPSVAIDYAVPVIARQSEVWYRYRTEGMDRDGWHQVQGGDGRIYFGHLPPGIYRVLLQASMSPTVWGDDACELLITVSAPWWRTPWAYLLYAILIIGVGAMLWRIWQQRAERAVLLQQIAHLLENQELMRSTPQMSPYDLIKDISPKSAKGQDFMERVDTCLAQHLTDSQLSVDTLADRLGMSSSTFYRRMKSTTSLSPNEYIRLYRLKKAALMLRQEGKTIREVSETLCFSSVAYFTNCFSRQFGVTPGEYCKQSSSPS